METAKIGILGASGYTGAELLRLIHSHPRMSVAAMTADRYAGSAMGDVFPQFGHLDLPPLKNLDEVDLDGLDLVFCALPAGITQGVVAKLPERVKIVDLSADFRLDDGAAYEKWYGAPHEQMDLQATAVYGLPEVYRDQIAKARLTANTGCYVATALLPTLPLLKAGVVDPEEIVIDAKSGATGAGRAPKEGMLYCEVAGGFHAYGVANHRHIAELDQEMTKAAGKTVMASFTPHLLPQARGILATIYMRGDADAAHATLTNLCRIGVVPDRRPGRMIVVSVLDNLMKGASGQAVQCANLMLGMPETMGLDAAPLFP